MTTLGRRGFLGALVALAAAPLAARRVSVRVSSLDTGRYAGAAPWTTSGGYYPGGRRFLATVHGPEYVMPEAEMRRLLAEVRRGRP